MTIHVYVASKNYMYGCYNQAIGCTSCFLLFSGNLLNK